MTELDWTPKDTRTLIKAVKHTKSIYEENSDEKKRKNSWELISQIIVVKNAQECQQKWENLLSTYKAQEEKSISSEEWCYKKLMDFVIPHINKKRPLENNSPDSKKNSKQPKLDIDQFNSITSNSANSNPENSFTSIESSNIPANTSEINNDTLLNDKNEQFFKMICSEMKKLSSKDQSTYRINVLVKLHEMLYNENDIKTE